MFVEICAYEFAHVVLFFARTGYFALILIINVRSPSAHADMLRLYMHLNFSFGLLLNYTKSLDSDSLTRALSEQNYSYL